MILTKNGKYCVDIIFAYAARVSRNKQYPNKQTLRKKEILSPRSCPLIATIAAPAQTITNTILKNRDQSSVLAEKLSHKERAKPNTSGPQRS